MQIDFKNLIELWYSNYFLPILTLPLSDPSPITRMLAGFYKKTKIHVCNKQHSHTKVNQQTCIHVWYITIHKHHRMCMYMYPLILITMKIHIMLPSDNHTNLFLFCELVWSYLQSCWSTCIYSMQWSWYTNFNMDCDRYDLVGKWLTNKHNILPTTIVERGTN